MTLSDGAPRPSPERLQEIEGGHVVRQNWLQTHGYRPQPSDRFIGELLAEIAALRRELEETQLALRKAREELRKWLG